MNRLPTTVASLALILCACAPAPTRDASPEPPAPTRASDSDQRPAETPRAGESAADPDAAGADETAEPVESIQPVAPESAEPPEPRREQEARREPEVSSRTEPAPAAAAEPPAPAPAALDRELALSGRITLTGGDADPAEAVVYFVPDDAGLVPDQPDSSETRTIVTRDKSLSPTVLTVSRGSEVRFPNDDPILHNLFSVSPENGFDLGVYGPGEAPAVTFEQPGVVNIYCNVHHDMHAHVLVVDTPWRTQPDPDGSFRLTGLPGGAGKLHIWHRQSERWSRPVDLPLAGALEATLEVTRPRLPPHRDKAGQSYNRRDRDPYR